MLSTASAGRSSTSGPRGRSQIFCFVNGIVLRVRMIVQRQALRSRWENLRVFVSPLSSRGPWAWPLSLVSSPAQHQASLPVAGLQSCLWHSPSVSTPSRQLPEAKAQTPLAPLQMLAKVPGSFSEPHIVFQMYPWGGRALAIRAITAFCLLLTGNQGLGVAGRKLRAGLPTFSSDLGEKWGFQGTGLAPGWSGNSQDSESVHSSCSSQTLISEPLCGSGPMLSAVGAQRPEVLVPASQELASCRLK